ncbi:hypothetical protein [Natronospora cellulosivora (SeqCode)]
MDVSNWRKKYSFIISLSSLDEIKNIVYGNWKITGLTTAPIYAMDEEKIKSLIGSEIIYKRNILSIEHSKYIHHKTLDPEYDIRLLSELDFWKNNRGIFLENIGIDKGLVIAVEVYNKNWERYSGFGRRFWIKDENSLVILWDGVYFDVKRISDI